MSGVARRPAAADVARALLAALVLGTLGAVLLSRRGLAPNDALVLTIDARARGGRLRPIWDETNLWKLDTAFGSQRADVARARGDDWLVHAAPWLRFARVNAVLGGNYAPEIAPWCDHGAASDVHPDPSPAECGSNGTPGRGRAQRAGARRRQRARDRLRAAARRGRALAAQRRGAAPQHLGGAAGVHRRRRRLRLLPLERRAGDRSRRLERVRQRRLRRTRRSRHRRLAGVDRQRAQLPDPGRLARRAAATSASPARRTTMRAPSSRPRARSARARRASRSTPATTSPAQPSPARTTSRST